MNALVFGLSVAFTPSPLVALPQLTKTSFNAPWPHGAAPLAGAAAASTAMIPMAAFAETTNLLAEFAGDDEETSVKILVVVAGIVLIAPILGIQGARKAISSMKDDDMDLGSNDPRMR